MEHTQVRCEVWQGRAPFTTICKCMHTWGREEAVAPVRALSSAASLTPYSSHAKKAAASLLL